MNRAELVERLRNADVPEALYEIPGVHDVPVQLDAFYFLRREADAWVVGLRQRSRDQVMERFVTEAGACEYLYREITRVPPPEPDGSLEELLADSEQMQQQAWEDFERAPQDEPGGESNRNGNGTGPGNGRV